MDTVKHWVNRSEKESSPLLEDERSGQSTSSPPKGSEDDTDMTDLGTLQSPVNQGKKPAEEGKAEGQSFAEKPIDNLKTLVDNDEEEIYAEEQPWWDGQTDAIPREDFETYKGLVKEKFKKARLQKLKFLERYHEDVQYLKLNASDRESDLEGLRDYINKEKVFEKSDARQELEEQVKEQKDARIKLEYQLNDARKQLEEKPDAGKELEGQAKEQKDARIKLEYQLNDARKQLEDQFAENRDTRQQLEVFNKAQREARRSTIHLPGLTADHSEQVMEQPPFLYSNLTDQNIGSKVHMLLLSAELAIESEDYQEADRYCREAFQQAQFLDFVPIEARCAYWRGRVAFAIEQYDLAKLAFEVASNHASEYYAKGPAACEWLQTTQLKSLKGKRALKPGEEIGLPPDAPIEVSDSNTDTLSELPKSKANASKRAGKLPNPNRSSIGPSAKLPESLGDAFGQLNGDATPPTGDFLPGNRYSALFNPAQDSGRGSASSPDVRGDLRSHSDSGELSD